MRTSQAAGEEARGEEASGRSAAYARRVGKRADRDADGYATRAPATARARAASSGPWSRALMEMEAMPRSTSSVARVCLLGALLVVGCGSRYTTQEAYKACQDQQERNPGANPAASFTDCVDCFESCGVDCNAQGTMPETYECSE